MTAQPPAESTRKCPRCGGGVKLEAAKCPYCGRRLKRGTGCGIIALCVLLAGGPLAGLVFFSLSEVRGPHARMEARITMQNMRVGLTSLKRNYEVDPMTPLGVHSDGAVEKSGTRFTAAGRDFRALDVWPGARVCILSGEAAGVRTVAAAQGGTLTLKGASFAADEKKLDYFIVRPDGSSWPRIDLAKELDPKNPAWAKDYTPHLNKKKRLYCPCKPRRIKDGELVDPWGTPYVYILRAEGEIVIEKIISAGPDAKWNTKDDLEEVITEIPLGAAPGKPAASAPQKPPPPQPAPALSEKEKIERLLKYVAGSGATFIRNGREHSAAKAAEHLRGKWKHAGKRIKTARQFIDHLATRSSMSGRLYQVRTADGREVPTGQWLSDHLKKLEAPGGDTPKKIGGEGE